MKLYADINGDSGVRAFEIGSDFIITEFKDGAQYLYTSSSAGSGNIDQMKVLAVKGDGLNSFINRNVEKRYSRKLR